MSLVASIVTRPDLVLHGKICFPDIYTKAASIMQAMRWHAFIDGQEKLPSCDAVLSKDGYYFLVPFHSKDLQ